MLDELLVFIKYFDELCALIDEASLPIDFKLAYYQIKQRMAHETKEISRSKIKSKYSLCWYCGGEFVYSSNDDDTSVCCSDCGYRKYVSTEDMKEY